MTKLKLGVLISGRGSNLQALIDACANPDFPAEIVLVISNIDGAFGLTRAEEAGIATKTISHKAFKDRLAFDEAISAALTDAHVDLICLAGFMRLLQPNFVNHWHNKLINIHPSLLPSFKGLHTHERAIKAGVRITGCTVHYVRAEVDDGPIIVQAAVPVLDDDSEDSLAARVLEAEHKIYPAAVRLIATGKTTIQGERVLIEEKAALQPPSLINPDC